jgi:DNA invertase Pin-like site-specific DNA recombinase
MRIVSYTRTISCFPGAAVEADAITQQNERIRMYASEHGWKIADKYSDRKKSKEENQAFERLLQDGIQRKFDVVIVDSIFRAGKDLWSAKEVLLQTLHYAGISFVVVEDDFIGIGKTNAEAEEYFDKKYGILRRETIRHQVLKRNREGVLSWNDAKYGYRLTEDYKLVINEETAPVVRRIFQMCADGISLSKVAEKLSEEKVPSPLSQRGTNVKIEDPYKWTRLSIRRLLGMTVYEGHWSKIVKGEEVFFTNEPIVTKQLFQDAQKAIHTPTYVSKKPKAKHKYVGLVADKERGFCVRYKESRSGEKYFTYADSQMNADSGYRRLPMDAVDMAVREALQREKDRAVFALEQLHRDGAAVLEMRLQAYREEYKRKALALAEQEVQKMKIYADCQNGKLSQEDNIKRQQEARENVLRQETYFKEHEKVLQTMQTALGEENPWIQLYLSYSPDCILDKETLNKYVSRIVVDRLEICSVELREQEWFQELLDDWRK